MSQAASPGGSPGSPSSKRAKTPQGQGLGYQDQNENLLQASPAAEKIDMMPKTHAKRARGDAVGKGKKLCSSTNRGAAEAEAGTENAQPADGAGGATKDDGKKRRKEDKNPFQASPAAEKTAVTPKTKAKRARADAGREGSAIDGVGMGGGGGEGGRAWGRPMGAQALRTVPAESGGCDRSSGKGSVEAGR